MCVMATERAAYNLFCVFCTQRLADNLKSLRCQMANGKMNKQKSNHSIADGVQKHQSYRPLIGIMILYLD